MLHSHHKVQIDVKGDGSIDFSNFVPSGTWDVSSGVGNVNFYTVPSLPHEMATSRYRNKTDITFNILVRRKVLTLNRDKSMVGMATNFTFHFYLVKS